MTAAQKTAKLKFKQAIAYRQKTGVTLKEAFAHIYGKKKVGVAKKKAAPKKKAAKKLVRKVIKKKAAPKKKIGNVTLKKSKYFKGDERYIIMNDGVEHLDGKPFFKETALDIADSLRKVKARRKKDAKKIGYSKVRLEQEKGITKVLKNTPRTLFPYTAKEKIIKAGKKYFDQEAKKINGIGSVAIEKYKKLNDDINKVNIHIIEYTKMSKDMGYNLDNRKAFKVAAIRWKKYQNELKRQAKELKKYI